MGRAPSLATVGAIASLDTAALQTEPGDEVSCTVTVRNAGRIVDEFTFEILGEPAAWATVEPPNLRLLPDTEGQARITFRPPRSHEAAAGAVPFGVKVNSREDPEGSTVEEGTLSVGAFRDLTAELLPRTSRGRRGARHELAVDNRGNHRVNTEVVAYDDDEQLEFDVDDPGLVAEPGTAVFTTVRAKPRKSYWRGANKTHPFHVQLQVAEEPVASVDGTMLQQPLLPSWTGKALLALLGLLLALLLLWFLVFKPTIESAAQEAVEEPLAVQGAAVDQLADSVNDINEQLGNEPVELPTEVESPAAATEEFPRNVRLTAAAGAGSSDTDTFELGPNETYELADIVLQNPSGNVGRLQVLRGSDVLFVVALENFRDLDYHFVSPIVFGPGQTLVLEVQCREVTADGESQCAVASTFSGTLIRFVPDE